MKTKIIALMILTVLLASAASAAWAVVESTDSLGAIKNNFQSGEDVYAKGAVFEPNDQCYIYIFENGNWQYEPGSPIPVGSSGFYNVSIGDDLPMIHKVVGPVPVTMNGNGAFDPKVIWSPADKSGQFDIIVDCDGANGYGKWDGIVTAEGISRDGVDSTFCIGFYVVPEQVIAVGLIALLVPGMIYLIRRKSK